MQSITDYLQIDFIQTTPDYFAFAAFIVTVVGVVSLVLPKVQINHRSGYYFQTALALFLVAILLGWKGILDHLIEIWTHHV